MKRFLAACCLTIALCIGGSFVIVGCSTTQQKAAVNTIFSLQTTTHAAYDAYIDAVIAGKASTNGVPAVSRALNQFNAATLVALNAAQFGTNAVAPSNLQLLSADLLNLIKQFNKK